MSALVQWQGTCVQLRLIVVCCVFVSLFNLARAQDNSGLEGLLAHSQDRARVVSIELKRREAETRKLFAEAEKALAEANVATAEAARLRGELRRIEQRIRLAEHEFNRVATSDFNTKLEIELIEKNFTVLKSLNIGLADWKTWTAFDALLAFCGGAEAIGKAMIDRKVGRLAGQEFITGDALSPAEEFPGGNLSELVKFVRKHNYAFSKFGEAHMHVLSLLPIMSEAAEARKQRLTEINEALRLTIVNIGQSNDER